MDFDNRKVYGDTSITDGLVFSGERPFKANPINNINIQFYNPMGFYLLVLVDYFSNDQLGITIAFVMLDILGKNELSLIYWQKYITPPTISFVWILFGLLHREPK